MPNDMTRELHTFVLDGLLVASVTVASVTQCC